MQQKCQSRATPLLIGPSCRSVTMSTGNVISMAGTRRRAGQSSTAELLTSLEHMLEIYQPTDNEDLNAKSIVLGVPCSCYSVALDDEERQPLSITVKLFPAHTTPELLENAVITALSELSVERVEAIVLSNPLPWEEVSLQQLVPLWHVLERLQEQHKVEYLGVGDFEQPLFEQMFASHLIRVRPSLVQINLTNCCSVPADLRDFCRQRDVQILTHNDAQEFLPEDLLRCVLNKRLTLPETQTAWNLCWSLRYLVLAQHTGVIKAKGYIVNVTRQ